MKINLALVALLSVFITSQAWAHESIHCENVSFPVVLSPGAKKHYQLSGELCSKGLIQGKTIQVLVHGASFDHNYWNFPVNPDKYSYAKYITDAGFAVLNIDRIGYGNSSRPIGDDLYGLNLHVSAYTLHQVITILRSGFLFVGGFGPIGLLHEKVELVGHSIGSLVVAIEASTYKDVDAVIQSGISHYPGPAGFASFGLAEQACFDLKFSNLSCDPNTANPPTGFGYEVDVPTLPFSPFGDTWAFLFFQGAVDPQVFTKAEQLRQTFTAAEIADITISLGIPDPSTDATTGIKVPTLLVNGTLDSLICQPGYCDTDAALFNNESSHYAPETCFEAKVVNDSGHVLNLHQVAPSWFDIAKNWSDRRVGSAIYKPATQPCRQ
jgi:pimeloyl-ACP methyl ester carboxylesterase